jgi:hypothetical protein
MAATKTSLLTLARRWQQLQAELDRLDLQLQALVSAAAPTLVALPGIGIDTAGQLLVTAGDNPQRLRSEASFAHLCGVAPSRRPRAAPTATGSTAAAIARPTTPGGGSPWSACAATHRPGPRSSGGPTKAGPSSTSCAAQSATSPARSTTTSPIHQPSRPPLASIGGISPLNSTDTTERNASMLRLTSRTVAALVELAAGRNCAWSWSPAPSPNGGPSSSATTSTVERRCRPRPSSSAAGAGRQVRRRT